VNAKRCIGGNVYAEIRADGIALTTETQYPLGPHATNRIFLTAFAVDALAKFLNDHRVTEEAERA
jgi:hypothetical protein